MVLDGIRNDFNSSSHDGRKISLADLIVLAGNAAVEKAAEDAGFSVNVPFTPGRMDALESQTDVISFAVLEPKFDGFRNYSSRMDGKEEFHLVDKASLLTLSIPEMTVLIGGMRALGATYDNSNVGVLTEHPGTLTNDFFVNLLDNFIKWEPKEGCLVYKMEFLLSIHA